jgi:hypothetical protein
MERLSRRNLIGAAAAIAGGAALSTSAATTAPTTGLNAAIVADPLLALDAERQRLSRAAEAANDAAEARWFSLPDAAREHDLELAALERAEKAACERAADAEDRFLGTPASTVAGLMAQLAVVREYAEAYDGRALIEPLATIEAGIKNLVAGGAA